MDDKDTDYRSLPHGYLCDFLSILEDKYKRQRDAYQIKKISIHKAMAVDYDRDTSSKVPRKKKARTEMLLSLKQNKSNTPNNGGIQCYHMLYSKAVMYKRKYMSHSSKICLGKRSN